MLVFIRAIALGAALLAAASPAAALELLMIERANCPYCKRWDIEIAPYYGKTEEGRLAPLRRASIGELPKNVVFETPVAVTPTFVLIDNGKEIGRVTGYSDDFTFWSLLKDVMKR
jgi:thioredoxin-related protein